MILHYLQNLWRQAHLRVGLLAGAIALLTGALHPSPYNNYVLLAQAFLGHHLWIDWPGPYIDALEWQGAHYVIEAPLPALLLMPFVWLFGTTTNQSLLGVGLLAITMASAWMLLERINVPFQARCWLSLFLFAGTDLWWCASLGDVWLIAHLAAFAATMLALNELAGQQRPWVVAAWGCAAAASRFSLILALPFYAFFLLEPNCLTSFGSDRPVLPLNRRHHAQRVLEPYLLVIILCTIVWIRYNEARWGLPYDIGYTEWYHRDVMGSPTGSPFQLRYFPYEFRAFFFSFPQRLDAYPWLDAPITGQALEFTSPALILSLFAYGRRKAIRLLWLATACVAAPSWIYYVDGFAQFGMRHALDFEPFLFTLMGLSVRRRLAWWSKLLCGYSALVGAWGVWFWHVIKGR